MDCIKIISLELSVQEINLILQALGPAPYVQVAAFTMYGSVVIELFSGNNYVGHGSISSGTTSQAVNGGISLAGLIDRVNVTATGSDTFDAGQIILYYA